MLSGCILLFCLFTPFIVAKEQPYYCTVSIHTDEFAYQLLEDDIHEESNVPLHGTAKNAKLFRDALQVNVFNPITKTYRDSGVPVAFVAGELKMVDCASQNVTQPFICSPSYSVASELVVEASYFWREKRPCILLYVSGHPLRDGTGRKMQSVGYTADGTGHYGMCAASTADQIQDYGHGSLIVISAVDMDDVNAGIYMDHLTVELRKRLNRAMGCDVTSLGMASL
ncbi:hypothetical protein AAVH_27180 [Aphelenchoides avenae]|nr:hypothetical protein AAVH_27180 [Aphelenchus avenae]